MKNTKYHQELGSMVACMNMMMETMKRLGQRIRKGATKDCFIFDSWFASKRSAKYAADVGDDFIGTEKTNTRAVPVLGRTKTVPG